MPHGSGGAPYGAEGRGDGTGLRSRPRSRTGEAEAGAVPQFLVEADDIFGPEDGGGRLVAPPVIGEAPSTYRDF
ncbi:hypothetical protein [Halopolyspora algeriensis]|uniref:hypothetical protein n=1 Tax=Halopolyspora algeriensis TaxID=1500506 RepID=UPI000DF229A7|nr:hypothetical protein [Halopolyspora algeriensis]